MSSVIQIDVYRAVAQARERPIPSPRGRGTAASAVVDEGRFLYSQHFA